MSLTEAIPKCDCGMHMYQFAEDFFRCRHCDGRCPYMSTPSKCERCTNYREATQGKVREWYPDQKDIP